MMTGKAPLLSCLHQIVPVALSPACFRRRKRIAPWNASSPRAILLRPTSACRPVSCLPSRSARTTIHVASVEDLADALVERIHEATEVDSDAEITVSGKQTMLAMEGEWVLKWRSGRFWEQFDGEEMTIEWGCDGDEPWAVDAAGRCGVLELDDREVCLLGAWIRTGFWVTKAGREQLLIRLAQDGDDVEGLEWAAPSSLEHILRVQLKDGKAGQRHLFPFSTVHIQTSENKEVYSVQDFSSELTPSLSYSLPSLPVVSRPQANCPRVDVDPGCEPSVAMARAESGHYLVQPLVDGKTIGYFIVDTGASSLIIAPEKARELGLKTFGEIYITGANGVVKSHFCRASTFRLGQLRISNPVFTEIPVSGLVGGDPMVVGICGFDVFAQCIVEMAYDEGRMSLFDPSSYRLLHFELLQWHTLRLMENVPYVSATFDGHTAQFLFDTGAGGIDIIFHRRAVEEFDLADSLHSETCAELMGINAEGKGLQVALGVLNQLTIGGRSLQQVNAMLALGNAGNLDTSAYVSGLLCGDLLMKCRIVFDYAQRGFAVKQTQRELDSEA